jgi:hypothetical protein
VKLLERLVELVEIDRLDLELVERERDVLVRQEAGLLALPNERLCILMLEDQRSPLSFRVPPETQFVP